MRLPPHADGLAVHRGAVFLTWLVLVFLFTPGINYHLAKRTSVHADDFLYTLQSTCQAALHHGNRVTVFTNGPEFYPAMLDAIRSATRSIIMECYIFQPGTSRRPVHRRAGRAARLGVNVTVVVDWIGSFSLWGRPLRRLRKAKCPRRVLSEHWNGIGCRGSTTARTGNCSSWMAGSRSWGARDRGLVGKPVEGSRQALARHDGARRRAGGRGTAGRGGRELARVLR